MAVLAPWSTGGQLPNFAPSDEDTTRHWLAALAERYDPAGVFWCGQVVRFAG